MVFTWEDWSKLSCEAQKWTQQAARDIENFTRFAFVSTSDYCNQLNRDIEKFTKQAAVDVEHFTKQAAQHSQGIGVEIAKAFQELGQELHKRFAGLDNLARLNRCDRLNEEVELIKINHQEFLRQLDDESKRCLIDLERFEQDIRNNSSLDGTSLANLSEALNKLRVINQDLLKEIHQCQDRVMQELSSMPPGNIFCDMNLNAMKVLCLTFLSRKLLPLVIPQAAAQISPVFGTISTVITVTFLVAQFFYRTYLTGKASDQLKQLKETLNDIETNIKGTLQVLDELCELACSRDVLQPSNVDEYRAALEDKFTNSLEKLSLVKVSYEKKNQ